MQSDGDSFGGDVVLDGVNMACKDEDNILDKIHVKQICLYFYYDDFNSL